MRNFAGVIVLLFAAGIAAAAQEKPAQTSSAQAGAVTISGCIERAPAPASGRAAAKSASKQEQFVLANAKPAGSATGAVGTSGTTATRYELDGNASELSKHVNHQVEITGTVQSSSASATGAANAAPGSTAATPRLKVTSVKMVANKCS